MFPIKDFNDIPDRNTETALVRLRQLIKELSNTQLQDFVDFSLEYPPRARALAGALLEWSGLGQLTYTIAKSLNPLSIYNFAIPKKMLPTAEKWKID